MVNNLLVRFYFSNFWVFHSALVGNDRLEHVLVPARGDAKDEAG